nr:protein kinase [Myxococcota bacterium]
LSSYSEMKQLGARGAVEHVEQRARFAEQSLRSAIDQADALLDRTRDIARARSSDQDPKSLAFALRDLGLERRGLKWLSVSFPDGTFQGAFREGERLRFQQSRIEHGRTRMLQYDFEGDGLVESGGAGFHYDPREREFYRSAVAARRRIWTAPYPFLPDYRSGISRAEPVFDAGGELHAVVTADYDVAQLSGTLGVPALDGRVVVFAPNGALLAVRGLPKAALPKSADPNRALRFTDLADPPLSAFFAARRPKAPEPATFESGGQRFFAVERALTEPAGLGWRLASITSESALFAEARAHAKKSLISSSAFVLGAILCAAAIALGIDRVRRSRARAERRVETLLERARQLGSYQLEERIGRGGMGEVWRARHRMLARPAAIKLIRGEVLGDDRERVEARFQREARALAGLRSPHTVSVFDFGRTLDGRLFLVMELLDGLPLDRVLKLYGPLPASRVVPILIGACHSLSEAHAAGIVHRDVKPANLFLCHDGDGIERVKVLDFGLVKDTRSVQLSLEGGISGTPDYMAPEQAHGKELDGRADLYSLGCTAFHLLAGRPVFREPSDVATLLAHQAEPPPSLSSVSAAPIPPELEALIARCLAKQPEFRPISAASLGRALAAIRFGDDDRLTQEQIREWWEGVSARDIPPPSSVEPRILARPA